MRPTFRHLLTYSLLATYASIAFLGEGLHWLTPDEHHHGPSRVVSAASDDAHNAGDSHVPTDKRVVATHGIDDHHDCEICDFLAQAVSEPPQIAETPAFATIVAEVAVRRSRTLLADCRRPPRSARSPAASSELSPRHCGSRTSCSPRPRVRNGNPPRHDPPR